MEAILDPNKNINGRECTYILLPADKKNGLGIRTKFDTPLTKVGQLALLDTDSPESTDKDWAYQFVYILSDDEIKEGDWITDREYIFKAVDINKVSGLVRSNPMQFVNTFVLASCKKIIATTNPELHISTLPTDTTALEFPASISQSDIEYIISLYNGKGKEVDIEKLKVVRNVVSADKRFSEKDLDNIIFGYELCLQDNADKKFTLDDVIRITHLWDNHIVIHEEDKGSLIEINKFVQSLTKEQSKSHTVMVQYEDIAPESDIKKGYVKLFAQYKPKLKDGNIVIVR